MVQRGGVCPACYVAETAANRENARAEATARAAEAAKKNNLPELSGSEKQIAWAETLRRSVHDKIISGCRQYKVTYKGEPVTQANGQAVIDAIGNLLRSQTDAKYYIDNRDNDTQMWLDAIAKYSA